MTSQRTKIPVSSFTFITKLIITLVLIFFSQNIYAQFNTYKFENISIEDGLPENSVTCIQQDYLGYLWLGTQNGLVKYDGYTMQVFQPQVSNPGSISGRGIATIFEDHEKTLWIGTLNGLNKFNRTDETFKCYKNNSGDTISIYSNCVHCMYEDKTGKFWVGTAIGLNLFDRNKEIFTRYYFCYVGGKLVCRSTPGEYNYGINAISEDPLTGDLLIGTEMDGLYKFKVKEKAIIKYQLNAESNYDEKIGWIESFYKSKNGKIWMASFNSLTCLDPRKKKIKSYIEFPISLEKYYSYYVPGTVIEDQSGLIWCGFFNGERGGFCLNPQTGVFKQFKISPEKLENSYSNAVYSLYEDKSGIIWIGTWMTGLMKFDKHKNEFRLLKSDNNYSPNCLSYSDVYSVIYDQKGFIWFCTRNALDRYNIKISEYKHYLKNEDCITQSPYIAIQDTSGDLWLGTSSCGLIRFNTLNNTYRFYFNNPEESTSLVNKKIIRLFQDHLGYLWIGTERFGIYKYDISKNTLTNYRHNPNDPLSLSQDQIRWIYEDRLGTIWVGTNAGGLNKYERATEKFTYAGFNAVSVIYEDKRGKFWVADYLSGLHLFDREKGIITESYNQKDGLASNAIFGILEDDHNNLWLGTEKGLSKFNTITKSFKHYHKENGLPDDWFEPASTYGKGPEGEMYFNTRKGLISFHPDSIKDDPVPPQIVLRGVSLFNRPGEKLDYSGFISDIKEITLPYDQNDLRFDFVGLHFSAPEKNKYKYILENFDKDWVDAGTQRNATYTNLNPGEYLFRVTSANNDGIWNRQGASIKIIILHPWWATIWAYIIYTVIILSFIYFTWRLQLKRIRIKHEFEMSRFEAEKLHEVDELKNRFFANISHEFRTPLTLIMGPVKDVLDKTKEPDTKKSVGFIKSNAIKLYGLVNQLLDLSKFDAGKMKLETNEQNIVPILKGLALSFTSYAERKGITLKFGTSENNIMAYIDKEKIEKIFINVLSNAFKFTPEGGKVKVNVKRNKGYVAVEISDSGIGIPKGNIPKIFDRFYQVDGSHKREQEGTGIGLALTKELIELHKGKISVESEEGKGTTFTVRIPLGKEHLKPEEICERVTGKDTEYEKDLGKLVAEFEEEFKNINKQEVDIESLTKEALPLLLIVEDNSDVRSYIKNNLKNDYKILEAINGEDGWNKSIEQMPDLIVSDIMMPKLDGFELCKKLKTDEKTSHIPIILLTAKASSQDKIEGFETGADEYLMKPFDTEELKARIKNLIKQRDRIHEHFRRHGIIDIEKSNVTSVDKKFLERTVKTISANISDSQFNVESLAEKLAVSRTVLHRKIYSLIGEPPVEFIRRIRLTKAAELIEKKSGNISEIALEVGFSSPAYFAQCFKKQFSISPSEYPPQN